jgi:hypothetical protein
MSSVQIIDASAVQLPQVTHTHSIWNNRIVFLVLGIGAGLLIYHAIQHFLHTEKKVEPETPKFDLTKRFIHQHFPEAANGKQELLSSSHAAGIIKVQPKVILTDYLAAALSTVSISCFFRNQLFFTQEMTRTATEDSDFEVFVPELPHNDKIRVDFVHGGTKKIVEFKVDQPMGCYEIGKIEDSDELKADFKAHSLPHLVTKNEFKKQHLVNKPLSVVLAPSKRPEFNFKREHVEEGDFYHFQNTTDAVHILFFEIQGLAADATKPEDQRLVVSVMLFPGETKKLNEAFLRNNWEMAYRATHAKDAVGTDLEILAIADVVV